MVFFAQSAETGRRLGEVGRIALGVRGGKKALVLGGDQGETIHWEFGTFLREGDL